MLLVITHHSLIPSEILRAAILAFHMPLFFVITGLFIKTPALLGELGHFVRNDGVKILSPYFAFGAVYITIMASLQSILTVEKGRLWFLPCLFVAKLYYYLLSWGVKRFFGGGTSARLGMFAFFVLLSWLQCTLDGSRWPFTLAHAFMAAAFIAVGGPIRVGIEKIRQTRHAVKWILMFALLAVCAVTSAVNGDLFNGACLMFVNEYGNYPFMLAAALSGSMASFCFGGILLELGEKANVLGAFSKKVTALLLFLTGNGILVFVTNEKIMATFREMVAILGIPYGWVPFVFTVIVCIFLTYPLSLLANRFLPECVGKSRPLNN